MLTTADRSDRHDRSLIRFVHLGGAELDVDVVGDSLVESDAIMTISGGTGVPGIGTSESALGYPRVERHVGILPIPEDEADNYNDALDDGCCVIAYKSAPADCTVLKSASPPLG